MEETIYQMKLIHSGILFVMICAFLHAAYASGLEKDIWQVNVPIVEVTVTQDMFLATMQLLLVLLLGASRVVSRALPLQEGRV